ncbi:MAG: hypothetical protein WDN26_00490 [Chitinophagaceae bacterium]
MKLIFATNNQHKVDEIRHVIGDEFELMTLKEAGIDIDIPNRMIRWKRMQRKNHKPFTG